jgi:acetylglutamate kinase
MDLQVLNVLADGAAAALAKAMKPKKIIYMTSKGTFNNLEPISQTTNTATTIADSRDFQAVS